MPKEKIIKIGDRVLLKNTDQYPNNEDIFGVTVKHYEPSTNLYEGDIGEWIVHWYNAPRYHKQIRDGRGYYATSELVKENGYKKVEK